MPNAIINFLDSHKSFILDNVWNLLIALGFLTIAYALTRKNTLYPPD